MEANRALLITPQLDAVQRLLVALKFCLEAQQNMPPFTEQLLEVTTKTQTENEDHEKKTHSKIISSSMVHRYESFDGFPLKIES